MSTSEMSIVLNRACALICLALVGLSACGPHGQAATAAGIDADKNGIRDDVDALIAKEFQESPAQTIYAQRLARSMQMDASTANPTHKQGVKSMKEGLLAMSCLSFNTSDQYQSSSRRKLIEATFNTSERRRNERAMGYATGPGSFELPKETECKL
jgi:hypothetical protein